MLQQSLRQAHWTHTLAYLAAPHRYPKVGCLSAFLVTVAAPHTSTALGRLGCAMLIPALLIGALLMFIFGDDPLSAYEGAIHGAFGSVRAWTTTIRRMTPLVFTGLSLVVAQGMGGRAYGAAPCPALHPISH